MVTTKLYLVPPPPAICPGFPLRVFNGDTLTTLSLRFGVSKDNLLLSNPQIKHEELFAGQIICIPIPPPPETCTGEFYLVVQGDNLGLIADAHSTTIEAIMEANPQIIDPAKIFADQLICIPGIPA